MDGTDSFLGDSGRSRLARWSLALAFRDSTIIYLNVQRFLRHVSLNLLR